MLTLLYVELNAFALAVLALIYLNVSHRTAKYLFEQKLFMALLASNVLILIFDTAMWVLDGRSGPFVREIYLLVVVVYYTLNPVICLIWSLYADYQIFRDEQRLKKRILPMMIPAIINGVLSFMSLFGNVMFYLDADNVYHRGQLFLLMALICYGYLMHTMVHIIRHRDRIRKQYYLSILVFALPPFIGGIIQTLFYGVSILWVCMTLSVLVLFINIQNDQLFTDHLTGLFNRRQLDSYLQQRIRNHADRDLLIGIMIDLDAFKQINDLYGHHTGDQALESAAAILRNTFRKCDFIARFGGDEFVVIMEASAPEDLSVSIARLKENVAQFNAQSLAPYMISLSIGCDFFDARLGDSAQGFLNHLDTLMYQDKAEKNAAQRTV